jgi:pyruvate kinase
MMETMITSLTPTRAEVNDVANLLWMVRIMLSGETAAGTIRQVIEKMTQIIEAVENSPIQVPQNTPQIKQNVLSLKTICRHTMANAIKAKQFVL